MTSSKRWTRTSTISWPTCTATTRRDEDDEDALYEVTCPNCGAVTTIDEEALLSADQELVCPNCGAAFDIELESDEDDEPRPESGPDKA